MAHAAAIRYGKIVYGLEIDFDRVVYQVPGGDAGFRPAARQLLLMLVVWVHGCIGVRAWLRGKSWYQRRVPLLAAPRHAGAGAGGPRFRQCGAGHARACRRGAGCAAARRVRRAGVAEGHGGRRRQPRGQLDDARLCRAGGRHLRGARGARLALGALPLGAHHLSGRAGGHRAGRATAFWRQAARAASACLGLRRARALLDLPRRRDGRRRGLPPPGPEEQRLLSRIGAPPSVRPAR